MKWQWLQHNEHALARQTSEWIEVLKTGNSDAHAAFADWLKESPRNVREYLLMVAFDRELSHVDSGHQFDVQALLAEAARNVVTLDDGVAATRADPQTQTEPRGQTWTQLHADANSLTANKVSVAHSTRRRLRVASAIAAGVVLALLGGYWLWPIVDRSRNTFTTEVGEQRTIELQDRSTVQLNTNSRMRAVLSADRREIYLERGEAIFKVERDTARPFRVHTADAVIQAIGTQFNIYSGAKRTKVSVLDGVVRIVAPAHGKQDIRIVANRAAQESTADGHEQKSATPEMRLVAGEEASIATGEIVKNGTPDVADTVAWRQRRLVFRADTLADIASEFNRYNRAPQVRLESHSLDERRYTGTFDADDPGALAMLLSREKDLVVETAGNEIVVRRRR